MDQNQLHAIQAMLIFMPFFFLIGAVIMLIPWWFIYKKAGFSSWLCILMVIPLVNLVMLYVLAFSEWKVVPIPPQPLSPYPYPPASVPPRV